MGISSLVVEWLRKEGHDATHLREEGAQTLLDSEILSKARDEARVLLTMDLDFGYLLAASSGKLPSVIIFRLEIETAEVIIPRLRDVFDNCEKDIMEGSILSVSKDSIRIRQLPIR